MRKCTSVKQYLRQVIKFHKESINCLNKALVELSKPKNDKKIDKKVVKKIKPRKINKLYTENMED